MADIKEQIDIHHLPKHIAVIMDGNGRWAKKLGRPRVFGHKNGVTSVREVTEAAAEIGIKYLTLYAFSTENWNRPQLEVNALMSLLVDTLRKEIQTLNKNNIRLNAIGDLKKLPKRTYKALIEGIAQTADNDQMTLTLALNYSSRWEIMEAVRKMAEELKNGTSDEQISEARFESFLSTTGIPDPELMIRTSGERRVSNFLLWQAAYTEFYFSEVFWPDFRKDNFYEAILDYQKRERRFGKISEQITSA